jgi:hypothetical protein
MFFNICVQINCVINDLFIDKRKAAFVIKSLKCKTTFFKMRINVSAIHSLKNSNFQQLHRDFQGDSNLYFSLDFFK